MRALRLALAAAGIVLGVLAYRVQIDNLGSQTSSTRALAIVAVAWAFLGAGLIAWARRPGNRLGPLLAATGFAAPRPPAPLQPRPAGLHGLLRAQRALVRARRPLASSPIPSGRRDRAARGAGARAGRLRRRCSSSRSPILLFYDGSERLRYMGPTRRESLLLVWENGSLAVALQKVVRLLRLGDPRHASSSRSIVRRLVPRDAAGAPAPRPALARRRGLRAARRLRGRLHLRRPSGRGRLRRPLLVADRRASSRCRSRSLAGMLRARLARANVGELVLELERTPPRGRARRARARARRSRVSRSGSGCRSGGSTSTAAGVRCELPAPGADRAVTLPRARRRAVAAIVHDASLVDEPELAPGLGRRRRLALENARLHAEMRAQLLKVQESRVRIVAAADEERRRIERDLHDGAQQRLVALALQLRSAQRQARRARRSRDRPAARRGRRRAPGRRRGAARARPRRPSGDPHGGRARAPRSSRSRRSAAPGRPGRLGRPAAGRRSRRPRTSSPAKRWRTSSSTRTPRRQRSARIAGTASSWSRSRTTASAARARRTAPACSGLADRVEALGGRLVVESPTGGGTRVVGEIPCAS